MEDVLVFCFFVLLVDLEFRWWIFFYYRLPVPRPGQVLGLVGTNGIGKSTALKVLAGKLKPNLGRFNVNIMKHFFSHVVFEVCMPAVSQVLSLQNPPDWQEILTYFRGSELQNYFTRILEDNLKVLRSVLLKLVYALWFYFFFQNSSILAFFFQLQICHGSRISILTSSCQIYFIRWLCPSIYIWLWLNWST